MSTIRMRLAYVSMTLFGITLFLLDRGYLDIQLKVANAICSALIAYLMSVMIYDQRKNIH